MHTNSEDDSETEITPYTCSDCKRTVYTRETFLRNATFVKTCIVLNVPKLNQKKLIKHLAL